MSKKILIVGAGPVGLTMAHELARRGFTPQLIDKAQNFAPLNESRALAIHLRTLDIFEKSGISKELREEGNLITKMQFTNNGHPIASLDLGEHKRANSGILSLPQGKTERIIAASLKKLGIIPQWQTQLVDLQVQNKTTQAHIQHSDGQIKAISFDIIIGCDGAHSQTRKSGGFSYEGTSITAQWSLIDVKYKTKLNPNTATANFIAGIGAFVCLPIDAKTARYVGTPQNIENYIARTEDIECVLWQSHFKISYRMVSKFHRENIFLAGDAAHIHSPVGGRGMNLGIEDAAWLAWMISENTQDGYSHARLPITRKTLKETKIQTRFVMQSGHFMHFIRTTLLPIVLKIKFLRKRVIINALALDTPTPPWLSTK